MTAYYGVGWRHVIDYDGNAWAEHVADLTAALEAAAIRSERVKKRVCERGRQNPPPLKRGAHSRGQWCSPGLQTEGFSISAKNDTNIYDVIWCF